MVTDRNIPSVCVPLTEREREAILRECASVLEGKPDIVEWRADYFVGICNHDDVISMLGELRKELKAIPLMFTLRSPQEGGNQRLELSEIEKLALYDSVCASGLIEYADFEMEQSPEALKHVRELCRRHGVKLILSYHDFASTPDMNNIVERCKYAEQAGADVAKVAVMPHTLEDVLTLLQATLAAKREIGIPLVTISMGALGALSRTCGWMFGSCLTFASGVRSSAPGQVPIEDVQAMIHLMQKAFSGEQSGGQSS